MTRVLIPILAIILFSVHSTAQPAELTPIETEITAITLHRGGGATITRSSKMVLPAGSQRLMFTGLSTDLTDFRDWRVMVDGAPVRATPQGVATYKIRPEYVGDAKRIMDRLLAIKQERDRLNDDIATVAALIKHLQAGDGPRPILTPDQLASIRRQMEALRAERTALREKHYALVIENDQLSGQLSSYPAPVGQYGRQLIELSEPLPRASKVSLSYYTDKAQWSLTADADLDSQSGALAITLAAEITQNTGEPWPAVPLTLGAPRGVFYGLRPDLQSQFWSLTDEKKLTARSMSAERLDVTGKGAQVTLSADTAPSPPFDQVIKLDQGAAIVSTARIPLMRLEQKADVIARSERGRSVQMIARFTPDLPYSLPTLRAVHLTRDGQPVAKMDWKPMRSGAQLDQPFGPLDAVDVSRSFVGGVRSDRGFLSGSDTQYAEWLYEARNGYGVPLTLEILDRIPVSKDEDLTITRLQKAAKGRPVNEEARPGIIMWQRKLAPGESWSFTHGYRWRLPKDKVLVGRPD